MNTDFDILIVGGGMVGASLGVALGALPLRVGLIEAVEFESSAQPSYNDRTVALSYGSKKIFESLHVWQRIEAQGATPIEKIHISDRGRFGFTRLTASDAGVEALGFVVENRALGRALKAALAETLNLNFLCPARMQEITFTPEAARVTVMHGDRIETLSARLVVAADGGNSAVRGQAGIEAQRTDYKQTALVTNVSIEFAHQNIAYERFTGSGPLALLPMRDRRCAVVWSLAPEQVETFLALTDAQFLEALQECFGTRLGRFQKVGKRIAYPLGLTKVGEHIRSRLVLIGNAAHTVHPVAGQGFNLGLRDVAALAQVLAEAQQGGEEPGDINVLQRYLDWRRRDNFAVSAFTDGLVRLFSNDFLPLSLARNVGLVAVDLLPPLKRRLLRLSMGLAGRLPRLARGLPL